MDVQYCISLSGWNKTTTPTGIWTESSDTYLKPSDLFKDTVSNSAISNIENYYTDSSGNISLSTNPIPNYALRVMDKMKKFPYIPGWALYTYMSGLGVSDWTNIISAGVDCNGFVSRSASYTGSRYGTSATKYQSKNEDVTNRNDWFTNPQYPYYETVPIGDSGSNYSIIADLIKERDTRNISVDLDKIKTGDIMYLKNSDNSGKHIAIVLSVNQSESIGLSSIVLIESTWAGNRSWAKVINTYTLQNYENLDRSWVVVRFKNKREDN